MITTRVLHWLSYLLVALTAPLSLFFVLRRIKEYERAVVLGTTLAPVSPLKYLSLSIYKKKQEHFPQSQSTVFSFLKVWLSYASQKVWYN